MVVEEGSLDVLMSIHPRHAQQILSGAKTVEFRRKSPKKPVAYLIVYATSPVQRVVAFARILTIVEGSIESLWTQFGTVGGITRAEFDEYFAGVTEGSALVLSDARPLEDSSLADCVKVGTPPPQSFRYVPSQLARALA